MEKLQGKQISGACEPLCTVPTVPTVNNNRSINLKMRTNPSNSERHRQKEVGTDGRAEVGGEEGTTKAKAQQ